MLTVFLPVIAAKVRGNWRRHMANQLLFGAPAPPQLDCVVSVSWLPSVLQIHCGICANWTVSCVLYDQGKGAMAVERVKTILNPVRWQWNYTSPEVRYQYVMCKIMRIFVVTGHTVFNLGCAICANFCVITHINVSYACTLCTEVGTFSNKNTRIPRFFKQPRTFFTGRGDIHESLANFR